jgi:hypothetical protein
MVFDALRVGSRVSTASRFRHGGRCLRASWEINASSSLREGSWGAAWRRGRMSSDEGTKGLVAKDEASLYVCGRTLSWLKVKQPDYRVASREFQSR